MLLTYNETARFKVISWTQHQCYYLFVVSAISSNFHLTTPLPTTTLHFSAYVVTLLRHHKVDSSVTIIRDMLITVQQDATQSSLFIILQVHFTWREVAAQKIWPVLEAVVTVLCTPDDGCGWHPKHVEWTCRIINRMLCVASRWTFINID